MKVAQIQMTVTDDKVANIQTVSDWFHKIKYDNVDLVCLPEMFNCPYDTTLFPKYAEVQRGETWQLLSEQARKNSWYIVGGSIPEIEDNQYYNTCYIFDRLGEQIGKHRKLHLFDIDIKGGQRFMESDVLSAGNQITTVDTEFGRIGVAICYDIRFPELMRIMATEGVETVFVPAAFNMTTGPAHWEILFRTRAVDNQVYLLGTASAQNKNASYHSYGHTILVSPWGEVLGQLGFEEGTLVNTIDRTKIKEIREQLPLLKHRRLDVYDLLSKRGI